MSLQLVNSNERFEMDQLSRTEAKLIALNAARSTLEFNLKGLNGDLDEFLKKRMDIQGELDSIKESLKRKHASESPVEPNIDTIEALLNRCNTPIDFEVN